MTLDGVMFGTIDYAQLQRSPSMKPAKTKAKTMPPVSCPLPPSEKKLVEERAEKEGTDVAKWLRKLIRRELAREPKT